MRITLPLKKKSLSIIPSFLPLVNSETNIFSERLVSQIAMPTFILLLFISLLIIVFIYLKEKSKAKATGLLLQATKVEKEKLVKQNLQKEESMKLLLKECGMPISSIINHTKHLLLEQNFNTNQNSFIKSILLNSERVRIAMLDLNSLTQLDEQGLFKLRKKEEGFKVIKTISKLFEAEIEIKQITLEIIIRGEENEIMSINAHILRTVVSNVLDNVIRYTPKGGKIIVQSSIIKEEKREFLEIIFSNNEHGFYNDIFNKIFSPISGKKEDTGNQGLSFNLNKLLTDQCNGEFLVNNHPDGDNIILKLRINDNNNKEEENCIRPELGDELLANQSNILELLETKPEQFKPAFDKKNILIIEKEESICRAYEQIFRSSYHLTIENTGSAALEQALTRHPDIIVCEVDMPQMSGLEITRCLKQNFTSSHIPVILTNNGSKENWINEALLAGADAFFEKNLNLNSIIHLVNNMVTTRSCGIKADSRSTQKEAKHIGIPEKDEKFLNNLIELIETNISQDPFGVDEITEALKISRTLLHVKLKKITNLSITSFIRNIKMKHAQKMLLDGYNVNETSFAVGMADPNYFTKCFKKEFGLTPSMYVKIHNKK